MKVLNTEQLAIMFFENRLKVTQRRLKKLRDKKKIRHIKVLDNQPYYYYLYDGKLYSQVEHIVMVNWIIIWFKLSLSSYESLFHFSYEKQNEIFRYDGLAAIANKFTDENRFYFIEVDLSDNKFDKVEKYNQFYSQKLYEKEWWFEYVKRFPAIIILTHRQNTVSNMIKKDNRNGIEFKVYGLEFIEDLRGLVKG